MGLKDELVVVNDPSESSEGTDEEESEADSDQSSSVDASVEESEPESPAEEEEEEEELVDPQDTLKEQCAMKDKCAKLQEELDRCTERVNSRSNTAETCAQEFYDFVHCVDYCVGEKLFSKLK